MSYVRVSILGTLPGGEVWSVNPVFDPTAEFPGGVNQANLDAACLAIANLNPGASLLSHISTAAVITGARLEVRDDATDNLIGISIQGRTTPLAGTGTPTKPAQVATVISIRTDTPGASGRGRIYWPALGSSLSTSTLRIISTQVTSVLTEMKTYLMAMRSALASSFPTIGFDLAVRSRTTHTTPHAVRIQVGDVLDTQRRRRDSLAESYQVVAVP